MDTCKIFFKKQFLSSAEEKVIQVLNDKKVKKKMTSFSFLGELSLSQKNAFSFETIHGFISEIMPKPKPGNVTMLSRCIAYVYSKKYNYLKLILDICLH